MGLTCESVGVNILKEKFNLQCNNELVIALAGNPNVGKSTVFNALTGLKQHTGNWPGKTVANARGCYIYKDRRFVLMDLPGTYSLLAHSVEEQVARDFICFARPHVTIVVTDATCLERNLNLVLQVMELTDNVVVCVNLMDEAKRKGISININAGLEELMKRVYNVATRIEKMKAKKIIYSEEVEKVVAKLVPRIDRILKGKMDPRWVALRLIDGDDSILDSIKEYIYDGKSSSGKSEVKNKNEWYGEV
jgi:ferrous iron transport protein B